MIENVVGAYEHTKKLSKSFSTPKSIYVMSWMWNRVFNSAPQAYPDKYPKMKEVGRQIESHLLGDSLSARYLDNLSNIAVNSNNFAESVLYSISVYIISNKYGSVNNRLLYCADQYLTYISESENIDTHREIHSYMSILNSEIDYNDAKVAISINLIDL